MECYEGATMIKTFRGLIASGTQDTIVLHTNDGSTGYRIVKLQIIPTQPFAANTSSEHILKIYKISQTTVDGVIDFSQNILLGVAVASVAEERDSYPGVQPYSPVIIFDGEIFNQDIYITAIDIDASDTAQACNYYLELEQVKLNVDESTVATLKDVRNKELRTMIA